MILTGAADGRIAPKAAVDRKESWRAGDCKEWDANDPKRSCCLEQTSCEQSDIASDQSPIVSVIGRAGYWYECRQKNLAR
jgi:hypothetical protein